MTGVTGVVARALLWAHRRVAMYGDTRYLLLCTNPGRKSGRVTVGESGLRAAPILGLIRSHGVAEAEIMWPQLTGEELSVLTQFAEDIPAEERPEMDVLRADLADAFQGFTGKLDEETSATLTRWQEAGAVLAELVRLKDGPRDDAYRAAKDGAWERARKVLESGNG